MDKQRDIDHRWMAEALLLAQKASDHGEVPVGAILVGPDNQRLGEGWNQPISSADPTAHAEVMAIRQAARATGNYRLPKTTLYVTLEPCTMCAGAMIHARIGRLVFATPEPKAGAVVSRGKTLSQPHNNHCIDVCQGVHGDRASRLISQFFAGRRAAKK